MAFSIQTTTSDGTLVLLDVALDYFHRDEISVFFDDVEVLSGWSWVGVSDKKIAFTPAVPLGVQVRLRRQTDVSEALHTYAGGAAFTPATVDESFEQILRVAQEAQEGANPVTDIYNDVDMHQSTFLNLRDAEAPQEPVTLNQLTEALVEFEADATAAQAAAAAAAASASAAAGSASAAATALDDFDDRYLGSKAEPPVLDNDGDSLLVGALYFDTVLSRLQIYDGLQWRNAAEISTVSFYAKTFVADGTADTYMLDVDSLDSASTIVVLYGVVQRPVLDYAVIANALIFTSPPPAPAVPGEQGILALTAASISTVRVADNAVGTVNIQDDAVTSAKLADNAVLAQHIAAGAVGSDELANGAVGEVELADGSVSTAKLQDAAVTSDKLDPTLLLSLLPVPTGVVLPYMGTVLPGGWLWCDGAEVPADATALDAVLADACGTGVNGRSLTPDMRGRFVRGLDSGAGIDTGRVLGSTQEDALKAHDHVQARGANGAPPFATNYWHGLYGSSASASLEKTQSTGGSETRPKNIAMYMIIKK